MLTILQQTWEKSETSWLKKLDGISLHKTPEDHSSFLKNVKDVEEYFKPVGSATTVEVSQELFDQVEETGIWIGDKDMPKFKLKYRYQGEENDK